MDRRSLIFALLVVAAFAHTYPAAAQSQQPFPHLGAILSGGSIDFINLPHIGNLNAAIFSDYPGYNVGGKTLQQQVAAVKALNPNMKITVLHNVMEVPPFAQSSGDALYPEDVADNANNWWLRTSYPSGTILYSTEGTGYNSVNITTPRTSLAADAYAPAGSTYARWQARFAVSFSTAVAPNLDGITTDNFFYQPRVDGDYLQNGTSQSASSIAQNWRNGYVAWDTAVRAAMGPQYMHWGNVADWFKGSIQGYNQLLNGGLMEGAIGVSWSVENTSWAAMMNAYSLIIKALAPFNGGGPYLLLGQWGSATDYQGARYGLASCLLDNGYIAYSVGGSYSSFGWFDEYGVSLGAPIAGPNNPNNGTYSTGGLTVWQNGVWRRDFANGIALVNPKGNGSQTVTLETTYKHFSGTQDPGVNNGQSVTSVTLNERDGVILLRASSQPVPDPPTLTVQ